VLMRGLGYLIDVMNSRKYSRRIVVLDFTPMRGFRKW
jgi:hypothetical protein